MIQLNIKFQNRRIPMDVSSRVKAGMILLDEEANILVVVLRDTDTSSVTIVRGYSNLNLTDDEKALSMYITPEGSRDVYIINPNVEIIDADNLESLKVLNFLTAKDLDDFTNAILLYHQTILFGDKHNEIVNSNRLYFTPYIESTSSIPHDLLEEIIDDEDPGIVFGSDVESPELLEGMDIDEVLNNPQVDEYNPYANQLLGKGAAIVTTTQAEKLWDYSKSTGEPVDFISDVLGNDVASESLLEPKKVKRWSLAELFISGPDNLIIPGFTEEDLIKLKFVHGDLKFEALLIDTMISNIKDSKLNKILFPLSTRKLGARTGKLLEYIGSLEKPEALGYLNHILYHINDAVLDVKLEDMTDEEFNEIFLSLRKSIRSKYHFLDQLQGLARKFK